MNKLVVSVASLLLASAGWWVGDLLGGLFTAFTLSMVGTGAGIYTGRRLVQVWGG
jgi:hypothetical protein